MYFQRIKRYWGHYFSIALVLFGLFAPIAANVLQPASAGAVTIPPKGQASWYPNPNTCSQGGSLSASIIYTDPAGNTYFFNCYFITTSPASDQDFVALNGPKDCSGTLATMFVGRRIEGAGKLSTGTSYHTNTQARLQMSFKNANGQCLNPASPNLLQTVQLTNYYDLATTPKPIGTAYWSKVNPLNPVGVLHATFTLGPFTNAKETFTESSIAGNTMILTGTKAASTQCKNNLDTIIVGTVGKNKNYWQDTVASISVYLPSYNGSSLGCNPLPGTISLVDQKTGAPASYVDAGGAAPTSAATDGTQPCPFDPNPLNFVLCAVFWVVGTTAQKLNDNIQATLYVNTSPDDNGSVFGPVFKGAFDVFRNIALTILILAALIMVASQAAGLELVSALTLKKKLPAIVFAAIGLSLAWPLLQIAVTASNDAGTFVQSVVLGAFSSVPGLHLQGSNQLLTAVFGTVGGATALIGLGTAGLFSLGLTVFVSLFVAFVTLLLRQIIIVLCVIAAPIAIALSVIPGGENGFKFWRSILTGSLTMFPIIMALLAIGEVISNVAAAEATQPNGGAVTNGWVFLLIAVVAKFFPYLMFGSILAMSNKTYAGINNAFNGRLKPFYESQARRRQALQAQHGQEFRAGSRYNDRNPVGRVVNTFGKNVSTGLRGGFGLRRRNATQAIALNQGAAAAEAAKNPLMQRLALNDDGNAYMFAAGGGLVGRGDIDRRLRSVGFTDERIANARSAAEAVGINHSNWLSSVQSLGQNKARALGSSAAARRMVVDTIDEGTRGNDREFTDTTNAFGGAAGSSGASTFSGVRGIARGGTVDLADSWDNTSMADLANSGDKHIAEFLDASVANLSSANQLTRLRAAVQLTEAQNLLGAQGVGASKQKIIQDHLRNAGYGLAQARAPGGAAEFFAARTGIAGLNGAAITRRARIQQR